MTRTTATLWLAMLMAASSSAHASSLVYTPKNPAFGGAAAHGTYLLNNANAQNRFKDPDLPDNDKTPIEQFNDRLQRALLGRITSVISRGIVGNDGSINPGSFETTDFLIDVTDLGGGEMSITTTDKLTGDQTSIIIETGL